MWKTWFDNQGQGSTKAAEKRLAKARERSVLEHEFPELAISSGLTPSIKENPPLIFHLREQGYEEQLSVFQEAFARYRKPSRKTAGSSLIASR